MLSLFAYSFIVIFIKYKVSSWSAGLCNFANIVHKHLGGAVTICCLSEGSMFAASRCGLQICISPASHRILLKEQNLGAHLQVRILI